jgi:hypothetical protein
MLLPPTKPQEKCPECASDWSNGITCRDHFEQMLAWELEYPEVNTVHHLTVACYHIQHPSLYSPEGLRGAIHLLAEFLDSGITPLEVRQRDRQKLDSGVRKYKIKGTPASHGGYPSPVPWTMTADDVIAGGPAQYDQNVKKWARSVLDALRTSGQVES